MHHLRNKSIHYKIFSAVQSSVEVDVVIQLEQHNFARLTIDFITHIVRRKVELDCIERELQYNHQAENSLFFGNCLPLSLSKAKISAWVPRRPSPFAVSDTYSC